MFPTNCRYWPSDDGSIDQMRYWFLLAVARRRLVDATEALANGLSSGTTSLLLGMHKPLVRIGLDWIGLDWIGLDWIGLDWIGLDWIGLDWIGLEWIGLDWIGLDWSGLDWIGLID
jgi:hypothetical protein